MSLSELTAIWRSWNGNPTPENERAFLMAVQAYDDDDRDPIPVDIARSYNLLVGGHPLPLVVIEERGGWLPWVVGGIALYTLAGKGAMKKETLLMLVAAGAVMYYMNRKPAPAAPAAPAPGTDFTGMV